MKQAQQLTSPKANNNNTSILKDKPNPTLQFTIFLISYTTTPPER